MSYSEKLANRVKQALSHLPKVEEKKMFSGITFMVNGKMCISVISSNRIMCRIDPGLHEDAVKRNNCQPVVMRGREYKGYIYIHEEDIKTEEEFNYWINLALDFNSKAKASKKKKKRPYPPETNNLNR
jgi:TfoX/Sxy family transcriptional regulator of competence genes